MKTESNRRVSSSAGLKWALRLSVVGLVSAVAAYCYLSFWVSRMSRPFVDAYGTRDNYGAAAQFRRSILETYPYYQTYALGAVIVGTVATLLLGLLWRDRLRKERAGPLKS